MPAARAVCKQSRLAVREPSDNRRAQLFLEVLRKKWRQDLLHRFASALWATRVGALMLGDVLEMVEDLAALLATVLVNRYSAPPAKPPDKQNGWVTRATPGAPSLPILCSMGLHRGRGGGLPHDGRRNPSAFEHLAKEPHFLESTLKFLLGAMVESC